MPGHRAKGRLPAAPVSPLSNLPTDENVAELKAQRRWRPRQGLELLSRKFGFGVFFTELFLDRSGCFCWERMDAAGARAGDAIFPPGVACDASWVLAAAGESLGVRCALSRSFLKADRPMHRAREKGLPALCDAIGQRESPARQNDPARV
jgi:hypothetical protein